MIQASDLKVGKIFVLQDKLWKVLEYKHTHMGRGAADVRVKIKSLMTQAIKTEVFSSDQKFQEAEIDKKNFKYLYQDDSQLIFMDPVTFEQQSVPVNVIGKKTVSFLQEGEEAALLFWQNKVIDIELPPKMVFEVKECNPGVKGNSATNMFKPAVLKNGITVKVPLFIKPGDKIKIETREGKYVERVS